MTENTTKIIDITDIAGIENITYIIANFLNYTEFFEFIWNFYKKLDIKYVTLLIHTQMLLKNQCRRICCILDNCGGIASFSNISHNILNQIVINDYTTLISKLCRCGVSFMHLPQDILNQIVVTHNNSGTIKILIEHGISFIRLPQHIIFEVIMRSCINKAPNTIVAILYEAGVLFQDLPQEELNTFVLTGDITMLGTFCDFDISVGNLPQDTLQQIKIEAEGEYMGMRYLFLGIMGYYPEE